MINYTFYEMAPRRNGDRGLNSFFYLSDVVHSSIDMLVTTWTLYLIDNSVDPVKNAIENNVERRYG
jgi:hypothetical protein